MTSLTQPTSGSFGSLTGSPGDNAALAAALAGAGSPIALPLQAWVEATGNDGTGTVGDPSKPYQTMLAAYNAGARVLHLGAGTHAGITKTGVIDVSIIGHGRGKTIVTAIESTTGGAISVHDLGYKSVSIGAVTQSYPVIAAGTNGASAGSCELRSVLCTGNVTLKGQPGQPGDGSELSGSHGGNAASLGGSDIEIHGDLIMEAVPGGAPFDDYSNPANAGNAGNAGSVSVTGGLIVVGDISLSGSGYYSGVNGGLDGYPSSGGSLNVDRLHVGGSLYGAPGDAASGAAMSLQVNQSARITAMTLDISLTTNGEINGQGVVIPTLMGSHLSSSGLVLSHINGSAVGTA